MAAFVGALRKYLEESANKRKFTSSAQISFVVKFAKLDLDKGASIGQLVHDCCSYFPKKEALEKLIEVANTTESEKNVVESIFDYEDQEGYTCMISLFDMATSYRKMNKKYPAGPMLRDIEESFVYLIELAKNFDLDFEKIINHTVSTQQKMVAHHRSSINTP